MARSRLSSCLATSIIPQPGVCIHVRVDTCACLQVHKTCRFTLSLRLLGFLEETVWEWRGRGLYAHTHLLFYRSRTKLSVIRKDIFELQTISLVLINLLDSSSWPQHNFRALLRKEHKHHSWLGPFSTLGGLLLTDTAILHFLSTSITSNKFCFESDP